MKAFVTWARMWTSQQRKCWTILLSQIFCTNFLYFHILLAQHLHNHKFYLFCHMQVCYGGKIWYFCGVVIRKLSVYNQILCTSIHSFMKSATWPHCWQSLNHCISHTSLSWLINKYYDRMLLSSTGVLMHLSSILTLFSQHQFGNFSLLKLLKLSLDSAPPQHFCCE